MITPEGDSERLTYDSSRYIYYLGFRYLSIKYRDSYYVRPIPNFYIEFSNGNELRSVLRARLELLCWGGGGYLLCPEIAHFWGYNSNHSLHNLQPQYEVPNRRPLRGRVRPSELNIDLCSSLHTAWSPCALILSHLLSLVLKNQSARARKGCEKGFMTVMCLLHGAE